MKMKKIAFILAALMCVAGSSNTGEKSILHYVDPDIGTTHCRWFFYTPAALPFGMAKLAPNTDAHIGSPGGWEANGYDYRHNTLEGFAHLHEFQIGGFAWMPMTGAIKTIPGALENPEEGFRSHFRHETERSKPGYYTVQLDDYSIKVELTATKRVGYQRYTFPEAKESHIILNVGLRQGESGKVIDACVTQVSVNEFEGWVMYDAIYAKSDVQELGSAPMKHYFNAVVTETPDAVHAFNGKEIHTGKSQAEGKGAGLYLTYFNTKANTKITVKTGLSYTSLNHARLNRIEESKDKDFDQVKNDAFAIWEKELSRIFIEDENEDNLTKFYTGLFHALLGRGIANDINGAYPKADGTIGYLPMKTLDTPEFNFINTDAIWGAFWNLTQLWALAYPEVYRDFVNTHVTVFKDRGWFSDGIANSRFTSGVGTNFIGLTSWAAYNTGIPGIDPELVYQGLKNDVLQTENRNRGSGKLDNWSFVKDGYVHFLNVHGWGTIYHGSYFSASHTLEYAFSAYAAARMAERLGKTEDIETFNALANGWKNLWHDSLKFIVPKNAYGEWIPDFNPQQGWRGFQEGNSYQYTFYVPHDVETLIQKMSRDVFNTRLDSIFVWSRESGFGSGKTIHAFGGVKNFYNHGNQPSLHMSFLFNHSGAPWLTQKWSRLICNEFYGTERIHGYGYGQDEDQGQLGAWYVIASMGLFDVAGLTEPKPNIQFGSPLYRKTRIDLANGKQLIIRTINNSEENKYVQSCTWNGQEYKKNNIAFDILSKGGELVFYMGREPNKEWGKK